MILIELIIFPVAANGTKRSLNLKVKILEKEFVFPTSENAYQSAKCKNISEVEQFTKESVYAGVALRLGRKVELTSDWEYIKVNMVKYIVFEKFTQNVDLMSSLLNADDIFLIEHTPKKNRDKFWANDYD